MQYYELKATLSDFTKVKIFQEVENRMIEKIRECKSYEINENSILYKEIAYISVTKEKDNTPVLNILITK